MASILAQTIAQRNYDIDQLHNNVNKGEVEKWIKGENTSTKYIKIDKEKYAVYKGGVEITFPKKEFKLLVLLASKPGKVFTREYILEQVWGDEVVVGDRTIDVHIRKLREKLGDNYIKTIKGIGYKFEF